MGETPAFPLAKTALLRFSQQRDWISGATLRIFNPFIQSTDLFTQLRVLGTSPASCSGLRNAPREGTLSEGVSFRTSKARPPRDRSKYLYKLDSMELITKVGNQV